jgi:transposase
MFIMESVGQKRARQHRSFTVEFKAEIVELCQRGDRSVGQVARDFDLTETAVREWVKQAERDAGTRGDGLTSSEREQLAALRRDNRRLREDVEILKRGGCCTNWLVLVSVSRVGAGLRPGRSRGGVQLRGWRSRAVDADAGVGGGLVA